MPGDYDFGLSAEQEQRAAELHASNISIDMCSMGPGGPELFNRLPQEVVAEHLGQSDDPATRFLIGMFLPYVLTADGTTDELETFCKGHTSASLPLAGIDEADLIPLARLIDLLETIDWMQLAGVAEDFRRAQREGIHVTYGYAQPGLAGLPRNLDRFDEAKKLGVRSVMLTYNRQDFVGSGCTERTNSGLTNYGIEVVEKMNDVGLIVDTAHCSRQTTLDACKFSEAPVTANHTSAEEVYRHDRAKSDEELRAVAETGGVVGVYAVPFFLAPSDAGMDAMLDHIDHIVSVVGWQHVGIGTDWPFMLSTEVAEATIGQFLKELGFREEHGISISQNLGGYDDARDFINITRGLVTRGYEDEHIAGILGGNFLRVFEEVCG